MADEIPPVPPLAPPPQPVPGVGLINVAPGLATTAPTPSAGAAVTGYNPALATATQAQSSAYTVAPKATVAGQLKEILDSDSPLLQQAEANARQSMVGRGLINSTIALSAGQKALYDAALPIAESDAGTFDRAATNTTASENQFRLANAAATTDISKYNTGQENAAFSQAADASNTATLSKELERIRSDTTLSVADKQAASAKVLADIDAATRTSIANIQASTSLTLQDKSDAANKELATLDNASKKELELIRADTSLSIAEKQAASNKVTTGMNNDTAKEVQRIQNAGSLANIKANGEVSTKLEILEGQNKLLLQNNSGAANIYSQALRDMSALMVDPNLNPEQKTEALNNQVQMLTDALGTMSTIAGTPTVSSLLNFSTVGNEEGGGSPRGTTTAAPASANDNTIDSLYRSTLGRAADQAGLDYWKDQMANGMTAAEITNNLKLSDEYKQMTGT